MTKKLGPEIFHGFNVEVRTLGKCEIVLVQKYFPKCLWVFEFFNTLTYYLKDCCQTSEESFSEIYPENFCLVYKFIPMKICRKMVWEDFFHPLANFIGSSKLWRCAISCSLNILYT